MVWKYSSKISIHFSLINTFGAWFAKQIFAFSVVAGLTVEVLFMLFFHLYIAKLCNRLKMGEYV